MNRIGTPVLMGTLFLASGCGCGEDEYDRDTACQEIAAAVEQAVVGCGQATYAAPVVCVSCERSVCIEKDDVEQCRAGILALTCDRITAFSILELEKCGSVIEDMVEACAEDDDDDDLFDD